MIEMLENNDFIETAEFSGNMYGTSKKSVQDVLNNGKLMINNKNLSKELCGCI